MTHHSSTPKTPVLRQTWWWSGDHQRQVTITNRRDDQPASAEDCRRTTGTDRDDDPASDESERADGAVERSCNRVQKIQRHVKKSVGEKFTDEEAENEIKENDVDNAQ